MIKKYLKIIVLIALAVLISAMQVTAFVPVTYTCCKNYSLSDGVQIDSFEDLSKWIGPSQAADTINYKDGLQGLKLISTGSGGSYSDFAINKNFSTVNNFAIWVYVSNSSKLNTIVLYVSSGTPQADPYFYDVDYNFRTGWNKLVFNKHNFKNVSLDWNTGWNSVMRTIRIRTIPVPGLSSNDTFDDLRYDMAGQRAKLMIEFDDGINNVYTNAYPILKGNNQTAVSYVLPGYINDAYYMNISSMRNLQSDGWDISSHTYDHLDLKTLNDAQLVYELNNSYDWLVANKFQKSAGFIAYPFGHYNANVLNKVEKRYVLGRAVAIEGAQQHLISDNAIRYIQRVISVYNTSSVQEVKNSINDTINARLLGILLFHGVVKTNPGTYEYLDTDFKKISDYIKSRSADVDLITNSEYVIPNIRAFTPVLNKTTRIYPNGSAVLITSNKYDEYMPNMTVRPSTYSIDIGITSYNETGGLVKFNETSPNSGVSVSYEIGDRIPNKAYSVKIYWANGTKYQDFTTSANSTGFISYSSTGFGASRYQEINITTLILPPGNVSGTVRNISSNLPIADAVVTDGTRSNTTDANGNYVISNIPAGTYSVTASALGYRSSTQPGINVISGQTSTVNFNLSQDSNVNAYWRFDENTGTFAADSSGNNNNGLVYGAAWTPGKKGSALAFDGINDYVDAGNDASLQITGAISLAGWVKINDLTVSSSLFGRGHGLGGGGNYGYFVTYYAARQALFFDTYSTTARDQLDFSNAIIDNNWHHIAATWDGTTSANGKKLYVDGVLIDQKTSTIASMGNPSYNFRIGIDSANYRPAKATIDEVKVYNRALSAAEILADYNGIAPPAQVTGLVNDTPARTTVNLSWNAIAGANYYQVFRDSISIGYTMNAYWNDTGLAPDTLYQYTVRANDSFNNWGQNSSTLNVRTAASGISGRYNVSGTVFDNTGSGLGGVLVQNGTYQNTTDTSGRYLITGLPNGTYNFVYSRAGYNTAYLQVSINGTDNNSANIIITPSASGLMAFWKFDEGTGTSAGDSSGNSNNGIVNGAIWTSGKIGSALDFDGINDYVDAGNNASLQITGAISLAGWVKISDLAVSSSLFGKGHGLGSAGNYGYFLTYYAPTKSLYFDTYSTTARDQLNRQNAIIDNNWHHIAATWDGTTATNGKKLYIDGVLVNQKTSSITSMGNPSYNFRTGIDSVNYRPAKATIDEVKVYNRALSAAEILSDYNNGVADVTPPVISGISSSNITSDKAAVIWITDEASDTQVEYGTTASYGYSTILDTNPVTSHSANLSGLAASTVYHYMVKSRDAAGNLANSSDQTFTTQALPGTISGTVRNISSNLVIQGATVSDGTRSNLTDVNGNYTISGLVPGSYTVTASASGYQSTSRPNIDVLPGQNTVVNFDLNPSIDSTPPGILSIISSNITSTSATISWTTNESSDTQVEYGTTTGYGLSSTLDTNPVTSHSVNLSGLSNSTLYHYIVKSRDSAGNLAVSADQTFTTSAPDTGLVAYWKFDENTGTIAADYSGNSNTGTVTGAAWIPGRINSALAFDGVNDYVNAGNNASLQITGAISLVGWVKINNLAVSSSLFGRGHGLGSAGNYGYFVTYYAARQALYFDTYSTTARDQLDFSNAIIDNNWHHIAATWDGTTSASGKKLYVDGVLIDQKTSTIASMGNPSYNFRIGIDSVNYRPANATIDEVKVYNRALSAAEVLADYNGG